MSFTFGANPNSCGGGGDESPTDEKDKLIEKLQGKLTKLKIDNKQLKQDNQQMQIETDQLKDLLGNMQAPTVFNQIQVNKLV